MLCGDVTPDQLNAYIKRVRDALPARIKVTTAEPWSTWLLTPEIGQYVDVIFVHLLPYWEGMSTSAARCASSQHAYNDVQAGISRQADRHRRSGLAVGRPHPRPRRSLASPTKPISCAPSCSSRWRRATTITCSKPTTSPGRTATKARSGAYWGLFDAIGHPKFAFTGLLRTFPEWRGYALLAAVLTPAAGPADPGPHAARAPDRLSGDGRAGRAGLDRPAGADRRHARWNISIPPTSSR